MPYATTDAYAAALRHFDDLPDSACVRLPVVRALHGGVSRSTIWRMVRLGRLPAPRKPSPRIALWRVGELRDALGLRRADA